MRPLEWFAGVVGDWCGGLGGQEALDTVEYACLGRWWTLEDRFSGYWDRHGGGRRRARRRGGHDCLTAALFIETRQTIPSRLSQSRLIRTLSRLPAPPQPDW